ncbi:MAG: biotin synthase BioB [Candidatus Margulisiibacteriota bacterium]|jgi:biotin synthase
MNKYYKLINEPITKLIEKANKIRQANFKNQLDICTISNAKSGACTEDCKFCAQSSFYQTDIPIYNLKSIEEIVKEAKAAKENGAARFGIVTSGNTLTEKELDLIADAISLIKNQVKIIPCASLGALTKKQLQKLKDAGLVRYHHNLETAPEFFSKIVSTHTYQERITTVKAAKSIGLEVCCGGIMGLGESFEDRINFALLLKKLKVDSVPLNFLIPIKGTPLEYQPTISMDEAIRTIALFRIILKDKIIKIAAGRESILKDFQGLGFLAGANGMLIGGYLTTRGRSVSEDQKLIHEIEKMWQ